MLRIRILLGVLLSEAAAGIAAELRQRFLQLLVGDAEGAQGGRIRGDPVLAHLATHGDDLGHAGDGQQSRAHHEIGHLAHAHRRDALGSRQCHQQDLPHDRVDRPHLGSGVGGKLALHEGQPLGDLLAIPEDVGAPGKLDVDDRKANAGNRAYARDTRQTVHLGFDQIGDALLDLLRRKALSFGHDA